MTKAIYVRPLDIEGVQAMPSSSDPWASLKRHSLRENEA
jgi:hypothetical protein